MMSGSVKNILSKENKEKYSLLQSEFPLDICYLNHAAISPWPKRTVHAVQCFADENAKFGATYYSNWLAVEEKLRGQIQKLINASSAQEIALLKNTSEALSVVACGINWRDGDNVVSTNEEFPSNYIVWQAQARRHGVVLRQIPVMSTHDPELALIEACDEKTRVLAISSVQYSSGLKLDLVKLGEFCSANNIYFCIDAIQSIGAHQFDVQAIKADFVMADAHKWMCGPEGIAFFYCRAEIRKHLKLHQFGWHMVDDYMNYNKKTWTVVDSARRFECGSLNMLGIHALSASLSLFDELGIEIIEQLLEYKISYLADAMRDLKGIKFLNHILPERRAGILNFIIQSKDMADIHSHLMSNHVICAQRMGGIRFSPHFYTDISILDKSLDILRAYI